jgi:hypothetical protein
MAKAAVEAVSQPQFIIQSGGVYYLTESLWPYEPGAAEDPDPKNAARHADAAKEMMGKFDKLFADQANRVNAVLVPDNKPVKAFKAILS